MTRTILRLFAATVLGVLVGLAAAAHAEYRRYQRINADGLAEGARLDERLHEQWERMHLRELSAAGGRGATAVGTSTAPEY